MRDPADRLRQMGEGRSITFLGLARNCAPYLPAFFHLMECLAAEGFPVRAFVGENGSTDGSRALLEKAGDTIGIEIVDTAAMAAIGGRMHRMAMGRTIVTEAARPHVPGGFIAVIDLDNILRHLPPISAFRDALDVLDRDPGIGGVAATSFPYYYDILALRWVGRAEENILPELERVRGRPIASYLAHRGIYRLQKQVSAAADPVCFSAFNGMCIYRAGDYFAAICARAQMADECEHVAINRHICANGDRRIHISRQLAFAMPEEHGPVGMLRFYIDRIARLLPGAKEARR